MNSIDVRDEICSGPILKVKIKINQLKADDVLEVLVDTTSKDDITRIFGKILGHQIISIEPREKYFIIIIKKKGWTPLL